ncbi:MAG: regulatory protein GemA [Sneathiellaceae bacterium]
MTATRAKAPADPARTRCYAAIHAGAKALGWDEELRRQVMAQRYGGKRSAKDLSDAELRDFARHIGDAQQAAGKKPPRRQPARAGKRALAPGQLAAKARALWLSLYHLGELADPSEAALDAWVQRQAGVASLRFADQETADRVIRGLRNWCTRCGFAQPDAGTVRLIDTTRQHAGLTDGGYGIASKVQLVAALRERLGQPWSNDTYRMSGADLDALIEQLGHRVKARAQR